jgi:hypothetical protein
MNKYILGSRDRVVDRMPVRKQAAITLGAGGLVLLRAGMLVVALVLSWHYGLLS